jgi:cell division protein FtsB
MSVATLDLYRGRKTELSSERGRIEEIISERKAQRARCQQELKRAAFINNLELVRVLLAEQSALDFLIAAQHKRLETVENRIHTVDAEAEKTNQQLAKAREREQMILDRVSRRNQQMQALEREIEEHVRVAHRLEKEIYALREQNKHDEQVDLAQVQGEIRLWESKMVELVG